MAEIRRNDDGTIDEVVGYGHFHLERMDDTWSSLILHVDRGSERVHIAIESRSGRAAVDTRCHEGC